MSPSKLVSCLSVVCVLGAAAVGASPRESSTMLPAGGFPLPEREFLLVNVGYSLCLTVVDGVAEGQPCAWDDAPAAQRWRYQDRQLISMLGGDCVLAPSLVPCQGAGAFELSYNLLTQHLVLSPGGTFQGGSCHVIDQVFQQDETTGVLVPRHLSRRAALESTACEVTRSTSRWVIVPL